MKKEKHENEIVKTKKKFSFKEYINNFLNFFKENLLKYFKIFVITSLIIIPVGIKAINGIDFEKIPAGDVVSFKLFINNIEALYITVLSGIVPYMYVPVVGFLAFIYSDVVNFVYVISTYGYLKGIVISFLPLIISVFDISMISAIGIYICKRITVKYKLSDIKHMNSLNFKISMYETLGKKNKVKEYKKKKEGKISKLEKNNKKLNYIQIGNTLIIVTILEFISFLIKKIFI